MIKCYPPRPRSFEGQKMTNCSTGKEAMRRKSDPSWHHERRSNSQKESYKNKNIGDFCIWSRFLQSWQKCSGNIFRMRKIIKGSWCSYCLYIDPPYLEQTFHGKLQKIWQFQRKNDLLAEPYFLIPKIFLKLVLCKFLGNSFFSCLFEHPQLNHSM